MTTTTRTGRPAVLTVLLAGALLLAGCSASDSGGASFESAAQDAAQDTGGTRANVEGELGAAGDGAATEAAQAAAREVVTTGWATLVASDPLDAAAQIASLTEEAGGRVERRSEQRATPETPASATLTLRLPAGDVNRALAAFDDLGEVTDVELSKEDVTATGRDLDARIAALETSTQRLTELMAQAGDTEDLLRVEQELSSRQGELDALRAQRADLSDQVAMSTIEVHVVADDDAARALAEPSPGFLGGLERGWGALVATGRGAAVALGAVLPWLAVAGVFYAGWRMVRARRRVRD